MKKFTARKLVESAMLVAVATVLAQAVSVAASLLIIRRRPLPFRLERAHIRLNGRLAVICTPVIAMGWGRSARGWETTISFRALEGTENLGEVLETAPYSGPRFEVTREDGGKDAIYCQGNALPAWSQAPTGLWRVFRYYKSEQISDFTHVFYTRLGINILLTALLGD